MQENMKETILWVDDEPLALKYAVLLFEDFDIIIANSADEAQDIVKLNNDISILITDYDMPGKNGYELLKDIQIDKPNIIRIIASGFSDELEVSLQANSVIQYRITKPWDTTETIALLDSIIEKSKTK